MSDPTVPNGNVRVFGPIITSNAVRKAVEATVKLWLPTYTAEVVAQAGLPRAPLPDIRSWKSWPDFYVWPEDQFPACVVVSPGTNGEPEMHNRQITVPWTAGVAIVVSAKDAESTADLIGYYAAAVRALLVQNGSLGGFAVETSFMAERYDEHPLPDQGRTVRTAMVTVSVLVEGINNRYGGPPTPDNPTEDPGVWPTIHEVDETVVPL